MSDKYVMDGDGVRKVGLTEWAQAFEKSDRRIALDVIGDMKVSTVFLGLDHSYGSGPPLLFETLVLGGPMGEEMERYPSKAEALKGHQVMVERCRHVLAAGSFGHEDPSPDARRAASETTAVEDAKRSALEQGLIAVNSILRDWVKGQVTAVECGLMPVEAVFLAHIVTDNGETLLKRLEGSQLLLPPPEPHP